MTDQRVTRAADLIRTVLDFPKPGIKFRDITPLLGDEQAFSDVIDVMAEHAPRDVNVVCGVESRGFIFGTPLALRLGVGFVPIRKPGKLPGAVVEQSYDLEYGSTTLALQTDALSPRNNVLLVDDLLATGGTLQASTRLVETLGARVAQIQVVLELIGQPGRQRLLDDGIKGLFSLIGIED